MKAHYLVTVLLAGTLVLSACSPSASVPPLTQPAVNSNPVSPGESGGYQPVESGVCDSVFKSLQQSAFPKVSWSTQIETFVDPIGASGFACAIYGSGTGDDFSGGEAEGIAMGVASSLPAGYAQDSVYGGEGRPIGTTGYRNGNALAEVSVYWEPVDSSLCQNKTLDECSPLLQPSQKKYTVMIFMAVK